MLAYSVIRSIFWTGWLPALITGRRAAIRLTGGREPLRAKKAVAPLVAELHGFAVHEADFHQLLAVDELHVFGEKAGDYVQFFCVVNGARCRIHARPVDAARNPARWTKVLDLGLQPRLIGPVHAVNKNRVVRSAGEPNGGFVMGKREAMHARSVSARAGLAGRSARSIKAVKDLACCEIRGRKAEKAVIVRVDAGPVAIHDVRSIPVEKRADLSDLLVRPRVVQVQNVVSGRKKNLITPR